MTSATPGYARSAPAWAPAAASTGLALAARPSALLAAAPGSERGSSARPLASEPLPEVTSVEPGGGPTHELHNLTVTIKGKNFVAEGLGVFFGQVEAQPSSIQFKSSTEITAEVPESEGQLQQTVCVFVHVAGEPSPACIARSQEFAYENPPVVESVKARGGPASGQTKVTIKGQELEGAKEVKFGETQATFRAISSTEIEATSPAHAKGCVPVVVTAYGGEGSKEQSQGNRYCFGVPVVEGIAAHGGPITGGESVTITGHGFKDYGLVGEAQEVNFGEYKTSCGAGVSQCKAISDSELEVKSPNCAKCSGEHGETVDVRVATPEGESPSSEADLYAFGEPFVEAVSPDEGSPDGGTAVTITGANLQGVKRVTIGGGVATRLTEISATKIVASGPFLKMAFGQSESGDVLTLRVENRFGTNVLTGADRFTVRRPPVVTGLENLESGPYSGRAEGAPEGGEHVRLFVEHVFGEQLELAFGQNRVLPLRQEKLNETGNGSDRQALYRVEAITPQHAPGGVDVTVNIPGVSSDPWPVDRFSYGVAHREPQGGFGVTQEDFETGPCSVVSCGYLGATPAAEFFTQAAGLVPYFTVNFTLNSTEPNPTLHPGFRAPVGLFKNARVDLPEGMIFDPQAVPQCTTYGFGEEIERCPEDTQVGVAVVTFDDLALAQDHLIGESNTLRDAAVFRPIYNLAPPRGMPLMLGFAAVQTPVFIKGGLSWHREPEAEQAHEPNGAPRGSHNGLATGDYHGYSVTEAPIFEGTPAEELPLTTRLTLFGNTSSSHFITMPSQCSQDLTYHMRLESFGSEEETRFWVPKGVPPETAETQTTTPAGVQGCSNVPFKPEITVTPETSAPDRPDGATVEVKSPKDQGPITQADLRQVTVTLPEGMTIDPSQANKLERHVCSEEQFGIEADGTVAGEANGNPTVGIGEVRCPESSRVGTFAVESPDLPAEICKVDEETNATKTLAECPEPSERRKTLEGGIYLAEPLPGSTPKSGEEYRVFLSAESKRYGVAVRQRGNVSANETTGRLETTIHTPQLPFSDAITRFGGGEEASLANPLSCGQAETQAQFLPYGGPEGPQPASSSSFFTVAGCPFAPPFNLSQAAAVNSTQAGGSPAFTLKWNRDPGQQYLIATKTTLPPGLVGSIADVPALCPEEQANAGNCPEASRIGQVRSASGAGQPYVLGGTVYLTGPYQGAPYGLSIVVPAEHVGPYDYGKIVSRAKIEVNPETAQVSTTASVPAIVGGAPVRLREIEVALDREGFMRNPTNCAPVSINSTLYGTDSTNLANPPATASQQLSSPFQATGCSALPFKPSFSSKTSAKTSRQEGASLTVRITQRPGEANIHAVETQLPYALPSRLPTLQKACTEGQFAQNPSGCPPASFVGSATAVTPLLRRPLTGKAILVSHGGREFPDLKFLLEGEGIKIDLTGHTDIKKGITYSRFETVPDTPISSFETSFPTGPFSLLAANGSFCTETHTSKERVPVRNKHGRIVRRHGHIVYRTTAKLTRKVPVSLYMPTTITGQNGAKLSQKTKIEVTGCGASGSSPNVFSERIKGHTLILKVKTVAKGKLTIAGKALKTLRRTLAAGTHTLKVPLSRAGIRLHRQHRELSVKLTLEAAGASASSTLAVRG